ncbi:MAG: 50S ribosomal protein L25/general stress protein Ctc [Bacteroidetes bacterium]|nr:50S ribosomal protein L25/general stress protein Ctc [Bacteroidota bacterium]
MKTVSISGSPRENVGKKDAKKNRNDGKVPCVLYGGKDQVHFVTDATNFKTLVYSPDAYTVKLNVNNKEYDATLQEIQFHPVTDNILHVDFLEIIPERPVIISIPVKHVGVPEGVLKGGKLVQKLRKLKIKAQLADLPDDITVDVSALEIGQSIKISDVRRDKITFLDSPNAVIIGVRVTRVVVEETPVAGAVAAEGAAAPAAGAAAVPAAGAAAPAAKPKK